MTEAEQKLWNFEVSLKEMLTRLSELKTENQDLAKKNETLEAQLTDPKKPDKRFRGE